MLPLDLGKQSCFHELVFHALVNAFRHACDTQVHRLQSSQQTVSLFSH